MALGRGVISLKPMMHIAYSHYFHKIYKCIRLPPIFATFMISSESQPIKHRIRSIMDYRGLPMYPHLDGSTSMIAENTRTLTVTTEVQTPTKQDIVQHVPHVL